ncbi:hypothetical protein BV25DRAFT_1788721, partial [Artomyces pyxidatus]
GTDAPEARRVEVTNMISTVIQFRAIDWGMESCAADPKYGLPALYLGNGSNVIDIYALVSGPGKSGLDDVIDGNRLSYRARPALGDKVASVKVDYGTTWTHRFHCAMDSLHAFVLTAGSEATSVQWWQDKQSESPGM